MNEIWKKYFPRYKNFIVPLVLNLLAVFLIFWVIFPQIGQIPQELAKIETKEQEIDTLNQSLDVLRSAPDADVDENFTTAISALPAVKDVATIFSALSSAASSSNTTIDSFSLSVGGIFGRAAEINETTTNAPTVSVTAQLSGADARALTQFGGELTKRLPLAEIRMLSMTDDTASYQIGFFYKPLDTNKIEEQDKISQPSQSNLNLLNQLKEWNQ